MSDRLEKLLRMMESDFDGERATAAGMITRMAKEAKQTVPEFLKAHLGGGGQSFGNGYYGGERNPHFAELLAAKGEARMHKANADRAFRQLTDLREELKRERRQVDRLQAELRVAQAGKPAQKPAQKPQDGDVPPWEDQPSGDWGRALLTELWQLASAASEEDPFLLDEWEIEFVNSMGKVLRDRDLTPKQRATVMKILRKLKKQDAEPLI